MHEDVAIIIPSRIGSTRLPRKALVKIGNKSLIEHVIAKLLPAYLDNLYVATDSEEIASIVKSNGATAIMTDENCKSGSDRVLEALYQIPNNDKIKYVINVQGDMPFVDPMLIKNIIDLLKEENSDIITPVVKVSKEIADNSSNVKVVVNNQGHAMYFSRSMIPFCASEFLYHVGIYGFARQALEKFVNLPQSKYENIEKLEQLRALENNMQIGVITANEIPISVDTPEDLEKAREYYASL